MSSQKKAGFTVVELLVVVVVISILATIGVLAYRQSQNQLALDVLKADLSSASAQLEADLMRNNQYPATEEASNNNQGLPKSATTTYVYSKIADNNYCLSAMSSRAGVAGMMITSDNTTPREGVCQPVVHGYATLIIRCYDSRTNAPLEGSVFGLYEDDASLSPAPGSPITTGSNGEASVVIDLGSPTAKKSYQIMHEVAPVGYPLNTNITPVELVSDQTVSRDIFLSQVTMPQT